MLNKINSNSNLNFKSLHIHKNDETRQNLEKLVVPDTFDTINSSFDKIDKLSGADDVFLKVNSDKNRNIELQILDSDNNPMVQSLIEAEKILEDDCSNAVNYINSVFEAFALKFSFCYKSSVDLVENLMKRY